jgi:hypothetical protein
MYFKLNTDVEADACERYVQLRSFIPGFIHSISGVPAVLC